MFIVFALQNTCSSMLHAAYISNLFCSHFCFRQFGQSLLLNWLGQSKSLEYSTCFSSVSHTVQFSWSFPKNSIIFFFQVWRAMKRNSLEKRIKRNYLLNNCWKFIHKRIFVALDSMCNWMVFENVTFSFHLNSFLNGHIYQNVLCDLSETLKITITSTITIGNGPQHE